MTTPTAYGWICEPCATPVLWGSKLSPYASTDDEGACHCCGADCKGRRREWRPMPTGAARHPASRPNYASHYATRASVYAPPSKSHATPPPAAAPAPAAGSQLSLF